MTEAQHLVGALSRARALVIVRDDVPVTDDVFEALITAGVTAVEITLNTPNALETLSRWRERAGDHVQVGLGTVLDGDAARRACDAGATFLVTPHVAPGVMGRSSVPVLCGALSPTEVLAAQGAGAGAVKVFPVTALGGAAYISALRGPFRDTPLVAVGGVGIDDARSYLEAGCIAVAVGSAVVPPSPDPADVHEAAKRLLAALQR